MVKLVSLHVNSDQPKQLGRFYEGVLGLMPAWSSDDVTGFWVGDFRLEIGNHSHVSGQNDTPARHFFDLMVEDVYAEFDRIVGLGGTVIQEPYEFSDEDLKMVIATLADLDGNYFQLVSMKTTH